MWHFHVGPICNSCRSEGILYLGERCYTNMAEWTRRMEMAICLMERITRTTHACEHTDQWYISPHNTAHSQTWIIQKLIITVWGLMMMKSISLTEIIQTIHSRGLGGSLVVWAYRMTAAVTWLYRSRVTSTALIRGNWYCLETGRVRKQYDQAPLCAHQFSRNAVCVYCLFVAKYKIGMSYMYFNCKQRGSIKIKHV